MKTRTLPITSNLTQGNFLRISLDGGCDLTGCTCSAHPFITLSNGKQLISVELTEAEAANVKRAVKRGTYAEVGSR